MEQLLLNENKESKNNIRIFSLLTSLFLGSFAAYHFTTENVLKPSPSNDDAKLCLTNDCFNIRNDLISTVRSDIDVCENLPEALCGKFSSSTIPVEDFMTRVKSGYDLLAKHLFEIVMAERCPTPGEISLIKNQFEGWSKVAACNYDVCRNFTPIDPTQRLEMRRFFVRHSEKLMPGITTFFASLPDDTHVDLNTIQQFILDMNIALGGSYSPFVTLDVKEIFGEELLTDYEIDENIKPQTGMSYLKLDTQSFLGSVYSYKKEGDESLNEFTERNRKLLMNYKFVWDDDRDVDHPEIEPEIDEDEEKKEKKLMPMLEDIDEISKRIFYFEKKMAIAFDSLRDEVVHIDDKKKSEKSRRLVMTTVKQVRAAVSPFLNFDALLHGLNITVEDEQPMVVSPVLLRRGPQYFKSIFAQFSGESSSATIDDVNILSLNMKRIFEDLRFMSLLQLLTYTNTGNGFSQDINGNLDFSGLNPDLKCFQQFTEGTSPLSWIFQRKLVSKFPQYAKNAKNQGLQLGHLLKSVFKERLQEIKDLPVESRALLSSKLDNMDIMAAYPSFLDSDDHLLYALETELVGTSYDTFTALFVNEDDENDEYYDESAIIPAGRAKFAFEFEMNRQINRMKLRTLPNSQGKKKILPSWGLPVHSSNAYYRPAHNHLVIPWGAMVEGDVFELPTLPQIGNEQYANRLPEDSTATLKLFRLAMAMGTTGSLVGHEISHGFDAKGINFDENGNFRPGWLNDGQPPSTSEKSLIYLDSMKNCVSDQFSVFRNRFYINRDYTDIKNSINGELTVSENLADGAGIQISLRAFNKIINENKDLLDALHNLKITDPVNADSDLTILHKKTSYIYKDKTQKEVIPGIQISPHALFLTSFGRHWCFIGSANYWGRSLISDPHAPPHLRVIGTLKNTKNAREILGCSSDSRLGADVDYINISNEDNNKSCDVW